MIKLLLIEDDSFKAKSLLDFVYSVLPDVSVTNASSLVEAINQVNNASFDLVLIDMAIPSHPIISGAGSPMSLLTGGLDVLLELKYLERSDPCVIITQYPDIELSGQFFPLQQAGREIKTQLDCDVLACIEYSEGSEKWKTVLLDILKHYENTNS